MCRTQGGYGSKFGDPQNCSVTVSIWVGLWHSIHIGPGLMMIVMKMSLPTREGREVVDFGKLDVEVSWAGWVNRCHSTHNT